MSFIQIRRIVHDHHFFANLVSIRHSVQIFRALDSRFDQRIAEQRLGKQIATIEKGLCFLCGPRPAKARRQAAQQ
jgi:hypothetical protein